MPQPPPTVALDLTESAASPLAAIVSGPAAALTAVVLVVGERVRDTGWGAEAAIALALAWPNARRAILADLDLENPALHELLGVELDEGVIDVIDFGVSLRRVLRPVRAGAFDLIAGNYAVAEPAAVLASEQWRRVLQEVSARRATLLAYVPAELPGIDALIERAGAVIVLAQPDEAATVVQRLPRQYAVLAVLTPVQAPAPLQEPEAPPVAADAPEVDEPVVTAAAAEPVAELTRLSDDEFERIRLPTDRASREALIKDMRDRQRAARMAPSAGAAIVPPPADASSGDVAIRDAAPAAIPAGTGETALEMRTETAGDDVALETLAPALPPRRPSRYRNPIAWTIAVVLLASLLAGAWRYLSKRREAAEAPPAAAQPAQPADTTPLLPRDTLPYAVALEAHRDIATAFERTNALRVAEPSMRFHIAPLEREGRVFYHVMAGPVADSVSAYALRDTLIAHGHKTTPTPTDVRVNPYAFLVGEHEGREAAEEQIEELRRLDIPGYISQRAVAPRYRVYVGGFAAPAESDVVRQLLRNAGIRDSLVTRTGSITQ